jgi:hypothetical protein
MTERPGALGIYVVSWENTSTLYGPIAIVPMAGRPSRATAAVPFGDAFCNGPATTSAQAWFPKARL